MAGKKKKAVLGFGVIVLIFASFALWFSCSPSITGISKSESKPIDHEVFNDLLGKYVDSEGMVNYKGFIAEKDNFQVYLNLLSNNHPNEKNWNSNERKAYWINAYNAFTIQLIVDNYPVVSIKDLGGSVYKVNTPWDKRFILIEGKDYDLNNIEHDILRKHYSDPRIHFVVNCASFSCPPLRNEAFVASKLDEQLEDSAKRFVNDKKRNDISKDKINISRIFKWFSGDFTEETDIIGFLNKYSEVQIDADAEVDYQEYLWTLNEVGE